MTGVTVSWALHDLRTGRRDGSSDADVPVYSASVIKVPVLAAVLRSVDRGELSLDEELHIEQRHRVGGSGWLAASGHRSATVSTLARAMIDSSDNAATNVLLDTVGYPAVTAAIADSGMTNSVLARHMMDLAARDAGRENLITAHDACTGVTALVRGSLLAPASLAFAAAALQGQREPGVLPDVVPPGWTLGHKTGELDGVRHDAGILWRDGEPSVAIAVLGLGDPGEEQAILDRTRDVARTALARYLPGQLGA